MVNHGLGWKGVSFTEDCSPQLLAACPREVAGGDADIRRDSRVKEREMENEVQGFSPAVRVCRSADAVHKSCLSWNRFTQD